MLALSVSQAHASAELVTSAQCDCVMELQFQCYCPSAVHSVQVIILKLLCCRVLTCALLYSPSCAAHAGLHYVYASSVYVYVWCSRHVVHMTLLLLLTRLMGPQDRNSSVCMYAWGGHEAP